MFRWLFSGFVFLLMGLASAQRLDQTSLGRFAAGHKITPNTATQDLLSCGVEYDGKRLQIRMYDALAKPLSLGYCGLDAPTQSSVTDLSWTGLLCRFSQGSNRLVVRESLLTPAVWFDLQGSRMSLFADSAARWETALVPLAKVAARKGEVIYDQATDGRLRDPWITGLVSVGEYRFPMMVLFHQNPQRVTRRAGGGVEITWAGGDSRVGVLPLYGARPVRKAATETWLTKIPWKDLPTIRQAAQAFLSIPTSVQETYAIRGDRLAVTNRVSFEPVKDEWGWSKPFAVVPPAVYGAKKQGMSIKLPMATTELPIPGYTGPLAFVPGASLTYEVPKPDVYGTILSPVYNTQLAKLLAPEVTEELDAYSKSVQESFSRPYASVFGTSAIGEGRVLTAEYMGYRMMSPAAKAKFDRYADLAAKDTIFNRKKCYAYGHEVGNNRKFLLDNYRIGGQDYVDAGWFGYNITAMWARGHYAGKWEDIRANWSWIRELFYGWNWSFSDWAVLYAPLYVDAAKGGNPKGYTDNMAMLPALYSWARMADKLGDKQTYADAIYMIVRDRIGRANRALVYAYMQKLGYTTEGSTLVSDQGNGPSLSFTGKYIPKGTNDWATAPVVRFGTAGTGLWFTTGSFFEPPSLETIDVLRDAKLMPAVRNVYRQIDQRYPRWYASPDVSETSHYQLFARGFAGASPEDLCYMAAYQDGLASGGWVNEAWHAYGYTGIWVSNTTHGSPYYQPRVLGAVPGSIETFLMRGTDNQDYIGIYGNSGTATKCSVLVPSLNVGEIKGLESVNSKSFTRSTGSEVIPNADGLSSTFYRIPLTVARGFTLYRVLDSRPAESLVDIPRSVKGVTGTVVPVKVTVTNRGTTPVTWQFFSTLVRFRQGGSATILPGKQGVIEGDLTVPPLGSPSVVPLQYTWSGRVGAPISANVTVYPLPQVTATLEFSGEPFVRAPELGRVHLRAKNWQSVKAPLILVAKLDGREVTAKGYPLEPGQRVDESIVLNLPSGMTGRQLTVEVEGPGVNSTVRQRVVVGPPKGTSGTVTLFEFANGFDGWYRPDWANGNKDEKGVVLGLATSNMRGAQGVKVLSVPMWLRDGVASSAFVGVRSYQRWTDVKRIRVQVYVPRTAPTGLTAQFFRMGGDWKWRDQTPVTTLKPGQWNSLEIAINGTEGAKAWNVPLSELDNGLSKMLDFGLKFSNGATRLAWRGEVLVDQVVAEIE